MWNGMERVKLYARKWSEVLTCLIEATFAFGKMRGNKNKKLTANAKAMGTFDPPRMNEWIFRRIISKTPQGILVKTYPSK